MRSGKGGSMKGAYFLEPPEGFRTKRKGQRLCGCFCCCSLSFSLSLCVCFCSFLFFLLFFSYWDGLGPSLFGGGVLFVASPFFNNSGCASRHLDGV